MNQSKFPKTTAGLVQGDYALLQRADGRYVPLVFLAPVPGKRVVFYGALIEMIVSEPTVESEGQTVKLAELAMIDVAAFEAAQAPIVGSVRGRLDQADIAAQLDRQSARSRVWGKLTPLKYANQLQTA